MSTSTTPAQPPAALFRSAALDRMASPDQLNMAAAIVRPGAWLLLLVGAIVLVSGILASIFITVPVKVDADGILLSPAGVRDVTAVSGGQLRKLDVHLGDHVSVGQTVAELEQPDTRQELEQAKAELRDAQDQLKATQDFNARTDLSQGTFRAQQKQNLLSSIDFTEKRIGWLNERIKGQQDLSDKGFVTKQAVLGSRVELGQAQEELARNRVALQQLTVDEGSQKIEREREMLNLNLKVESAQRHVDMLTSRMARTVAVESPYDGIVAELKVNEGEVAERGTALMTLIPADIANATEKPGTGNHSVRQGPPIPLIATIYVAPTDGKRVMPGMEVEVLPSTAKREEFGFIVGHVTSVSAVPATQEGMQREIKNHQMVATLAGNGAPFEVRVALEIDVNTPSGFKWSSSQGPNTTLSGGSPCKAEIVTRSETILQMLIPALKRVLSRFT
jgi:HlyD family secretion protein